MPFEILSILFSFLPLLIGGIVVLIIFTNKKKKRNKMKELENKLEKANPEPATSKPTVEVKKEPEIDVHQKEAERILETGVSDDLEAFLNTKWGYAPMFFTFLADGKITVNGKTYLLLHHGPEEHAIHKLLSERFQKEKFGEVIFEESFEYQATTEMFGEKYPKQYGYKWHCVLDILAFAQEYKCIGMEDADSEKYNPLLKYLINYHNKYPEVKLTPNDLEMIISLLYVESDDWVYKVYGDDYYERDRIEYKTEDELRDEAWSNPKIMKVLFDAIAPGNERYAYLYAKNLFKHDADENYDLKHLLAYFPDVEPSEKRKKMFFLDDGCEELLPYEQMKDNYHEYTLED